ncbi:MAG: alpha/beta fold hydrolase [Tatlockia sp.]|nr:alpha/beta fold hydrolase [Tatlockia sp.]
MNLNVEIRGQGKALVFFHGWGFDYRIWLELTVAMEERYTLYLVDLPGFGLSSLMEWDYFKQKLLALLPKNFAIIGWSMGGLMAMRLALEESSRVTHLISISSSPRFIKEQLWPGVDKTVFDSFFQNLNKDPQGTISQFVSLQLDKKLYCYKNDSMPAPASLKAGLDILAEWDLREPLRHFTKPTCFIFGRLDAITPRTTMSAMQKIYPDFDYIMFEKAAHMPFLSHQDEFIASLERVLE